MKDTLSDIYNKIKSGSYQNEEHVRLSLVARILVKLDWNIWDPNEVNCEYVTCPYEDSSKVDIALFSTQRKPDIFIEVKAIGKIAIDLEKTEIQLRDYNRDNTALFSIITDGQNWRFYFPRTGGVFSKKCFKIVNLLEDDLIDVENTLNKFLAKSEIKNGHAEEEAQNYLQLNTKQREMEDKLPEAKRAVLVPPYPSLPEELAKLVNEEGFQITAEEARNFIKDFGDKPAIPQVVVYRETHESVSSLETKTLDPHNPPSLNFAKIIESRFDKRTANNWANLLRSAIIESMQRGISINELLRMSIPVREGLYEKEGYHPIREIGISLAGVDNNRAWELIRTLAQKLNVEVIVKFRWRDKEEAAYPRKEGLLQWKL